MNKLSLLVQEWRKRTPGYSTWDDAADELEAALAQQAQPVMCGYGHTGDLGSGCRKMIQAGEQCPEHPQQAQPDKLCVHCNKAWGPYHSACQHCGYTRERLDAEIAEINRYAQPEMPTREMIAEAIRGTTYDDSDEDDDLAQTSLREADAVLALFAPKPTWKIYCANCSGPYGHPEPCGA